MCIRDRRKRVDPSANPKEGSGDYKNRHGALCRLAEIYLSYAEALNEYSIEKGTYTANQKEILKYVNLIRERAGIPEYSVSAEEGKITACLLYTSCCFIPELCVRSEYRWYDPD